HPLSTLSLHDARPISSWDPQRRFEARCKYYRTWSQLDDRLRCAEAPDQQVRDISQWLLVALVQRYSASERSKGLCRILYSQKLEDRKSTRLNSSHEWI